MDFVPIIGAVVCGWAALRIIGGERERRLRDLPAEMAIRAAAANGTAGSAASSNGGSNGASNGASGRAAAANAGKLPVRSKAAR